MKIYHGQRLIKRKGHGKPGVVYVISGENDHLIKLSPFFPYVAGFHPYFFIHRAKLEAFYMDEREGTQLGLFARKTRIDRLKEQHLKSP